MNEVRMLHELIVTNSPDLSGINVAFLRPEMERTTLFTDVILPLAIPNALTYRVPADWNDQALVGCRVVVQLRDKKLYTGVIRDVHQKVPQRYEAKYLEEILDDRPVVTTSQIALWTWIADYYCCTLGEVMNAAMPAGLKLASETRILLSPSYSSEERTWDEKEELILEILQAHPAGITIKELPRTLGFGKFQRIIKGLIEQGAIITAEELREKYKPRTAEFLSVGPAADTSEKLEKIFAELEKRKAHKQVEALMIFLQLSQWDEGKAVEVERSKLQQQAQVNAAVVHNLADKGILVIHEKEVGRLRDTQLARKEPRVLSDSQANALLTIGKHWETKEVVLLHGVTSSGKTELYAELIHRALSAGQQVLYLLPEIALTTQIITRLRQYFGKRIGVYHSGYSDNERTEVWYKVLSNEPGECDIVLGARSALFLPFSRLGLVIVDEEHETSFKQHDPAPRYNARDLAIVLAAKHKARVLLGSATPSIETYWNALQGKYGLVEMNERYGGVSLPEVVLADLRKEKKSKSMQSHFSSLLIQEMQRVLQLDEQVILFQNRRGYSPLWQCHTCGWVPQCTRCDVSLTYHKAAHQLKCHYCGYTDDPPTLCAACGSSDLRMLGFGTEKIEEDISLLFPDIRVARMDLDTTRSKSSYHKIIHDFEAGHVQVLVGTQMVTKGLDFSHVSLVGILSADRMMNFPDFRSMERSYQLMAQVSGRAGRKDKRGKVIIQTYQPDHWLLDLVIRNDYQALYRREISERQQFVYPPFARLIRLIFKHIREDLVATAALEAGRALRAEFPHYVLGPEKPLVPRVNTYYLQQIMIKLPRTAESQEVKYHMIELVRGVLAADAFKPVRLSVDVDPI